MIRLFSNADLRTVSEQVVTKSHGVIELRFQSQETEVESLKTQLAETRELVTTSTGPSAVEGELCGEDIRNPLVALQERNNVDSRVAALQKDNQMLNHTVRQLTKEVRRVFIEGRIISLIRFESQCSLVDSGVSMTTRDVSDIIQMEAVTENIVHHDTVYKRMVADRNKLERQLSILNEERDRLMEERDTAVRETTKLRFSTQRLEKHNGDLSRQVISNRGFVIPLNSGWPSQTISSGSRKTTDSSK